MKNTAENEEKYFWAICLGDCMPFHQIERWISSYWRMTYAERKENARNESIDWHMDGVLLVLRGCVRGGQFADY